MRADNVLFATEMFGAMNVIDPKTGRNPTLAPAVTPMVRVPPNGGEKNQWIAKQVLDIGVFGILINGLHGAKL